jgi:hypothetical protein
MTTPAKQQFFRRFFGSRLTGFAARKEIHHTPADHVQEPCGSMAFIRIYRCLADLRHRLRRGEGAHTGERRK